MTLSVDDIQDLYLWRQRQFGDDHKRWDILSAVWHGQHHKLFPEEFRRGQVPKLTGFIRRSWKMFVRLIAKQLPDVYVGSRTLAEPMTKQADEIEKVCMTYYNVWDFERKLRAIATYEVGFGAFGIGVVPHGKLGWPIVLVEDPRNIFPSADWTSTSAVSSFNSLMGISSDLGGSLSDVIVRKMISGHDLRQMHPGHPELMALIPDTVDAFRQNYPVLQFYDKEYWVTTLADSGIQLAKTGHGAPWCPWQFACTFAPNAPAGDSDFFQQIGLEIAFMRLLDQKLALNDAVTWPWLALSGGWEVDANKRLLEAYSSDAKAQLLTPPAQFQVDRDSKVLSDLLRLFNMETEATQGSISGGPITGRGIMELNAGPVVGTLQDFFADLSYYFRRMFTTALIQDREIFGDQKKDLAGWGRGETFFGEYTPMKVIGEKFGPVRVEWGPGIGGFEGHMQLLQSLGAETLSSETAMEKNPHIRSVITEKRRLVLERLENVLWTIAIEGNAAVPMQWVAEAHSAISKGADPIAWVQDHPPGQATAIPENVAPIPPELAAAGQLPGGQPETVTPPPLAQLLGLGG